MPGVLILDHFPCEFDGESYYISEIDAARVEYPGDGDVVSIRIIPDNSLNNLKYGDTTLFLTFNDARLLAQAILSVAFEGVRGPQAWGRDGLGTMGLTWDAAHETADPEPPDLLAMGQAFINELADPEPTDLLGAEPETGRLPADPRPGYTKLGELLAFPDEHSFEPMDTDALERVDAGGTEGIIKAMEGGLA